MQFLSNILDIPVDRPQVLETTALGAAMLAGLADGAYNSLEEMAESWQLDAQFEPGLGTSERRHLLSGWSEAVTKTRTEIR